MGKAHEIIIVDRNPRIREFLRRELTATGYNVQVVKNRKAMLELVSNGMQIDLLILDPDFPCVDAVEMVRRMADRIPQMPVILHCVRGYDELAQYSGEYVVHIEKNGNSAELLKDAIHAILAKIGRLQSQLPHDST